MSLDYSTLGAVFCLLDSGPCATVPAVATECMQGSCLGFEMSLRWLLRRHL